MKSPLSLYLSWARIVIGASGIALSASVASAAVPAASPVVLVVEENHSYESVIGNPAMPFFNRMASRYGVARQYYANTHYSLPNYFWLTAGQPLTYDDGSRRTFDVNNLVRQMLTAGKSWKSYAEGLPYAGYVGYNTGFYVKHHNPFAYFSDVANSSLKSNIVPFTQFRADMTNSALPDFAFVAPNILHDGHDGNLATVDHWLSSNIAPILSTPDFAPGGHGILIITFDESFVQDCRPARCVKGNEGGGRVATIIVGPAVKRRFASNTVYRHQNLLRTIGVMLGLHSFPGGSASAAAMSDFF
jgi:phosphatidylinositol-3-phosphatase